MKKINLSSGWKMRRAGDTEYISAVVPGTVYTDLLREGKMEDPYQKDNEIGALKLMDNDYEYTTSFGLPPSFFECGDILLRFEGVDTIADVYLNGTLVGSPCNMHRIWEYEVKNLLREGTSGNELRVVFHSPTKYIKEQYEKMPTKGTEDAMDGFVHIRKAHYMFGWDWGAHLPDAGLFRDVSLIAFDRVRIDGVYFTQEIEWKTPLTSPRAADRVTLSLEVLVQVWASDGKPQTAGASEAGFEYRVKLTNPDGGSFVYDGSPKSIVIENPRLWWPNGYGAQPLYTVTAELFDNNRGTTKAVDEKTYRIGIRSLTVNRKKDEWGESFAFCVNETDIFAMGADYIPEDHLLGRVSPRTTRALLEKCKWANFNSLRVWGGGYYPDDWFYDICDELGLVVWQDFMFACAVYDLNPGFEANIRAEARDNIKRLRHHPSLGLWCGNNEMEEFVNQRNEWVSTFKEVRDYLFMYERVIPEVLVEYDPNRFYWPSSPSSGGSFDDPQDPDRGDAHYWEVWHGNKPFSEYRKHYFRFLSEFGFQSFPAMRTIERISDDPDDWNIFSYIMERHQRNGSANGKIMNYMQQTFRYPSDFKTVIYASQLLQAEAVRYGVEHFRRNRGRCMGAMYWQLNDCWPVASWSSVDYFGRLKALHYYAKRFFAPVMISCEEQGMITSGKEPVREHFEFEKSVRLNVANETFKSRKVTVHWALRDSLARILKEDSREITVPALGSVWLEKVEFPDADVYSQYVSYDLTENGVIVSEGTVIFSYPKYFRYEDPKLSVRVIGDEIEVTAEAYAKSVEILNDNEDLILSDNYFDMSAGKRRVRIEKGDAASLRLRSVFDIR